MSIHFEDLHFSNFISSNGFCVQNLENLLGSSLDWDWVAKIRIDFDEHNFWIWSPLFCNASIASAVYNHVNKLSSTTNVWKGW